MTGKFLLPLLPLVLFAKLSTLCGHGCTNQPTSLFPTIGTNRAVAAEIDSLPSIDRSPTEIDPIDSASVLMPTSETPTSILHAHAGLSSTNSSQSQQLWRIPVPDTPAPTTTTLTTTTLRTPVLIDRSFGPIVPYVSALLSRSLPAQRTLFEDSFDGDLSNFKVDSGAINTHGAIIQPNPLTSGNALRLEVRRDDPLANNKLRSEVVPRVNRNNFQFGTDYFYQFRTYLPPDWETDRVGEVIIQWHGRPDRELGEPFRRPPLSLNVDGEFYELVSLSDSAEVNRTDEPGDTFTESTPWRGIIERGRWVDWAFHVRWSYEEDGLIRVWKDGRQVATHQGPNAFNDRTPPFFKLGIYKWIWTRDPDQSRVDRRVMWLDDISIGVLE